MSDEAIMEKIRKLLRLGKSPHAGEAQTAMAMAAKLAARHQIDLGRLKTEEAPRSELEATVIDLRGRYPHLADELAMTLCNQHFHVEAVLLTGGGKCRVAFFSSRPETGAIAAHVFRFVTDAVESCWLEWLEENAKEEFVENMARHVERAFGLICRVDAGPVPVKACKRSFVIGFFYAVNAKVAATLRESFTQEEAGEYALAVTSNQLVVRELVAKIFGELKPMRFGRPASDVDMKSVRAGVQYGDKTQIYKPIAGGEKP